MRTLVPSLILVLVLGVVLLVGSWVGQKYAVQPGVNGDSLGMEREESYEEYQDRAAASLAEAPAEQAAYALVVFRDWATAQQAGQWLEPLGRVNAEVIDGLRLVPLPEPVEGATRAEVLNTGMERERAEVPELQPRLSAVVVRDTGEALRSWAGENEENLSAVEVLPPDAVWSFFGVLPTAPIEVWKAEFQ
ncbi:hypothetical protein Clow_00938 [Corynebacterium lowii]|uniref:Uncharacterized protein n=2 Tax=Corynebacterium lowii TaxID=1544413 RepID=A0A0N8W0H7_9CORY|nr:hypothetical protein Clow_00938 [Corynebacterium lowii]